jgi:hypothetical protein
MDIDRYIATKLERTWLASAEETAFLISLA